MKLDNVKLKIDENAFQGIFKSSIHSLNFSDIYDGILLLIFMGTTLSIFYISMLLLGDDPCKNTTSSVRLMDSRSMSGCPLKLSIKIPKLDLTIEIDYKADILAWCIIYKL